MNHFGSCRSFQNLCFQDDLLSRFYPSNLGSQLGSRICSRARVLFLTCSIFSIIYSFLWLIYRGAIIGTTFWPKFLEVVLIGSAPHRFFFPKIAYTPFAFFNVFFNIWLFEIWVFTAFFNDFGYFWKKGVSFSPFFQKILQKLPISEKNRP